jgi:hypothetical protein
MYIKLKNIKDFIHILKIPKKNIIIKLKNKIFVQPKHVKKNVYKLFSNLSLILHFRLSHLSEYI